MTKQKRPAGPPPGKWAQFTATGSGHTLWINQDIDPGDLMIDINASYVYLLTEEEEREGVSDGEKLAELANKRLNAMSPEEATDITNRMIRLVINAMLNRVKIYPTKAAAKAGYEWLKDQCRSMNIIMPNIPELVLGNIVLNFVLSDWRDQYRLFVILVNRSGMFDDLGDAVTAELHNAEMAIG